MEIVLVVLYVLCLLVIFIYAIGQFALLLNYLKRKPVFTKIPAKSNEIWPKVTVQLPVYNERYVVERLLDAVSLLDYPTDKLEIQVLDDSDDESLERAKQKVQSLKALGFDISHITRFNRKDFKAGALREGLSIAKGEFIAIFDADFIPKPDFLRKTIGHFSNPKLGLVQVPWEHLNRNYSLLTKVQAFALDAHFSFEQGGRNFGKHFMSFNGSAGIWRKRCIEEAGNWSGKTLTEDLDLSYRAQLKGWQFMFSTQVGAPAELPKALSAMRTQQFRWNKGGAENFRLLAMRLICNKKLSLRTKFFGTMHLFNSTIYLVVFLLALLSVPMLWLKSEHPQWAIWFDALQVFGLSTLIFSICFWYAFPKKDQGKLWQITNFLGQLVSFFAIMLGLSLQNGIAVLQGHLGKKSPFVRTPKFNAERTVSNVYLVRELTWVHFLEALMFLYGCGGIYSAWYLADFGLVYFHVLMVFGFGYLFTLTIKELVQTR